MSHTFIRSFNNKNRPILAGDKPVERTHFNLVRLTPGETYRYRLSEFESVVVPLTGTCDLTVNGESFLNLGHRTTVWDGKADAVYAGPNADVAIVAQSDCEIAIAGGWWDRQMAPFRIRPEEVEMVDVGSHETKSRRAFFISLDRTVRAGRETCSSASCTRMKVAGLAIHRTSTIPINPARPLTKKCIIGVSIRPTALALSSGMVRMEIRRPI